jgi:hypothetical protein
MSEVRVGGARVPVDTALTWARSYLQPGDGFWAYPAYDGYGEMSRTPQLTDADLLAPILLNVRMSLRAYSGLQQRRAELDAILTRIDPEMSLASASDADLQLIGNLFGVLDDSRIHGVRATILAKVLHRKRPAFIPLYDKHIRCCYQDFPDSPVPIVPGASWADFMIELATAIRQDLQEQETVWTDITQLASGPQITPLRALDIVGWFAGRPVARRLEPRGST